jgi:hypothetical protein
MFDGNLMTNMDEFKARPTVWFCSLWLLSITACSPLPAPEVISSSPDGFVLRQETVSPYGDKVYKRDDKMALFAQEYCWSHSGNDAIIIQKAKTKIYVLYSYKCGFNRRLIP